MTTPKAGNTIDEYVNWLVPYVESLSESEAEFCAELARAGIADKDTVIEAVQFFRIASSSIDGDVLMRVAE